MDGFDSQSAEANGAAPAWKQEVNQRLAAHRNRRPEAQDAKSDAADAPRPASGRAAEAAARVAARYAKAPSYKQLLAGEARAAVRAAGAAAEAARSAHAAAQAVLAGLESSLEPASADGWEAARPETTQPYHPTAAAPRWQDEPPAMERSDVQESPRLTPWTGVQSRWEETAPAPVAQPETRHDAWSEMRVHPSPEFERGQEGERYYRRGNEPTGSESFTEEHFDEFHTEDPLAHATVEPVQHLPANLIEFPRELVATRKARPHRAEGPLYDPAREDSQLSIFEVEPPLPAAPAYLNQASAVAPPEWASIELDHPQEEEFAVRHDAAAYAGHAYARTPDLAAAYGNAAGTAAAVEEMPEKAHRAQSHEEAAAAPQVRGGIRNAVVKEAALELLVARMSDRLLAMLVDGALVTLAYLAAAVVVIAATSHPPAGKFAVIASVCGWGVFAMLYQLLFLSYAEEGTPGMRYARIALCTFDDDNPTPAQMRMRIPAMLAAMLPAGLGLIWALWDKDHLGWHDRMTKTYQRKY